MSELLRRQQTFTALVPQLLEKAIALKLVPVLGECERGKVQAAWNAKMGLGVVHSCHTLRLAVDVLLFTPAGMYLTQPGDYAALGAYWKTLHPLARWGGDFTSKDADHFSLESPEGWR